MANMRSTSVFISTIRTLPIVFMFSIFAMTGPSAVSTYMGAGALCEALRRPVVAILDQQAILGPQLWRNLCEAELLFSCVLWR